MSEAWVTLATTDAYALGALVMGQSLVTVGTSKQLCIMLGPNVSPTLRQQLQQVFNHIVDVDILDSRDKANLALIKRPDLGVTFTKLHCWRLVQFSKCVFIDADCLIIKNSDELFERDEFTAAPDIGWPDTFNTGLFVYRPSEKTYSDLVNFAVSNGSFDGGDQGLLNQYFNDWYSKDIAFRLPFIYNVSSSTVYTYTAAFHHFGQQIKIVHFLGQNKPWHYSYDPQSKNVRDVGSDFRSEHLNLWWQHSHTVLERFGPETKYTTALSDDGGALAHEELPADPVPVKTPVRRYDYRKEPENVPRVDDNFPSFSDSLSPPSAAHDLEEPSTSSSKDVPKSKDVDDKKRINVQIAKKVTSKDVIRSAVTLSNKDITTTLEGLGVASGSSQPKPGDQTYDAGAHRKAWEEGKIDYTGRDSFTNIQKKLDNIQLQQKPK